MPELPDVETYKRYLDANALHKRIDSVCHEAPELLEGISAHDFRRALVGHRLRGTHRHGKYLFAALDRGGPWLVLHFGMTGRLDYFQAGQELPRHTRLCLEFNNGYCLAYIAQRKLGHIAVTDDVDAFVAAHGLGPDALSIDPHDFQQSASGYRGAVKSWLMNQRVFAGIGNVYSDEILFQGRIHPKTKVAELSNEELARLFNQMHTVLNRVIGARADPAHMPSDYLLHRRQEGQPCPRCQGRIKQLSVSGRRSYYCPHCQPAKP